MRGTPTHLAGGITPEPGEAPKAAPSPASPPSKWSLGSKGGAGGGRLLTMKDKLSMAKLLEDNKAMGPRRVEA